MTRPSIGGVPNAQPKSNAADPAGERDERDGPAPESPSLRLGKRQGDPGKRRRQQHSNGYESEDWVLVEL
jgi:hypothetical protein